MASHQPNDQPLQELKHEAVPGYRTVFSICFAAMSLYLAVIIYSSPGQVEHGHDYHGGEKDKEGGHHANKEMKEKRAK